MTDDTPNPDEYTALVKEWQNTTGYVESELRWLGKKTANAVAELVRQRDEARAEKDRWHEAALLGVSAETRLTDERDEAQQNAEAFKHALLETAHELHAALAIIEAALESLRKEPSYNTAHNIEHAIEALSQSPSAALQEHDREVAAGAIEDAMAEFDNSRTFGFSTAWLRARAAASRAGATREGTE